MPIPFVNMILLRQVVDVLDTIAPRHIVDRALREADVNRDLLRSGPGFLPYVTEAVIVESVARSLGEKNLGALTGQKLDYAGFGSFAKYVLAAPDLCDALVRSRRAIPLIHPGTDFSLRRSGDHLVFGFITGLERAVGHRHISEGAVFLITYVFRYFLGQDWRPAWIELAGTGPKDKTLLEDLTGTEVFTGADILAIGVPTEDLFAVNPLPPDPNEIVTLGELPSLMGVVQPRTTIDMVREVMHAQLVLGDLSEDSVARRLSMGSRTLQRALMTEGSSFRELRNDFIEARACALLSDSDVGIDQIARSLGYAEPNSFRRAFRNWTGVSPRQFRETRGRGQEQ